MSDQSTTALDAFRLEVHLRLALEDGGILDRPVVDVHGEIPVVVALDEERLPVLLRRIDNAGGYANVFTKGTKGIRAIAVMDARSALFEKGADALLGREQPGADSTVGMFADYLEVTPSGVVLPAQLATAGRSLPARQAEILSAP